MSALCGLAQTVGDEAWLVLHIDNKELHTARSMQISTLCVLAYLIVE